MSIRSLLKRKLVLKASKDSRIPSQPPENATLSASGSSSSRYVSKYGLHRLSPIDDDVEGLGFGPDIVAIHGLNGDPYETWTHENGRLWLRDFLPSSLPTSRVYTFGYSSEVAFTKSRGSVDQYARILLNELNLARHAELLLNRPLVFVCHSLGGIVLKRALVIAQLDSTNYGTIHAAVAGAIFLGTPHRGSSATRFPALLAKIAHIVLYGPSRITGGVREDLINLLKRDASQLHDISKDFVSRIEGLRIVSCIEMNTTPPLNKLVVDETSGILQVPGEVVVPMDGCDHRTICRFPDSADSSYLGLAAHIDDIYRHKLTNLPRVPHLADVINSQNRLTTLPFDRDVDFVGRADIIGKLDSTFAVRNRHRRAGIWGLGGIGKSQIAIEYAYRVMAREPATSVFWAHASSAARFVEAYQDIGIRAGILERKDATADIMRTVSDWLSSEKSGTWLLIVDNVDDASVLTAPTLKEIAVARSVQQHNPQAKALMSCIPQCQHGSVLVTSRFRKAAHSIVGDYDSLFQVDSLSAPDAVLLLQTKLTLDEEDAACVDDFVRTLELIPLAITQAAAYVHERAPRMTLRRYLQEFARSESNRLTLLDQSAADLRRDPNVSSAVVTTWAISFHQILEQYPSAAELLSLVSVLDSQSVPEFLLNPAEDRGRLAFEDDLAHLLEFAMISLISKDNAIRVHPLVQLAMRSWLEQNGQLSRWKREAIKLLSERFPDASDYNNMQACKQLFPHAEVTAAFEFGDDESLLRVATVLGRVTRYMLTAGYVTTQDRAEWALRIRTGVLGAEHPDTLASVCDLAQVLQNQGKYEAAEEMNRRALEGREKVLGRHHADTLKSVANLAMAMQCQGKYERAEQMNRRAIEGREEMLGPDHADTLSSVSSHAEVLLLQGKYEAAEEMNRRALEGREKVLGHDHPDTLTSVSNLALVLRKQGKYGAAEEMNRRALEEREMMLGPDHPDTLTSVNNLALVLQDQGKYGAAEEMNRRALTGFEKMLGPDHPDTLASIDNLAAVLRRQGKYDAAEEMNRRAMVGYEKVLGPDHPDTLTSVNNLASVLQDQGRYEAAEEMNRRALTGYEKTLGCDHPYTLTSVSVLAVVLRNQGKYDAAEEMNRRALEGREKVLGRDHPHTLASVESLVSVLQCQNKYDAAEEIKRQHKRT